MINYRKIFNEGLNADDDFSVISKGQWVNASNIRTFTTDSGATGRIEAVGGNTALFTSLPTGTNKCIGGVADESKKRIYWFNWNSNGSNGIYCYDKLAATTYTVLLEAQVLGGLNFDKYNRVFANAKLIGNLIVFTDNLNEPRCFNVEAGIKLNQSGYTTTEAPYATPVNYTTLTLIKRPPIYPVTWTKSTDTTYKNDFIDDGAFKFTYRYRYRDNQVSALAAYGKLVPYSSGNRIDITIPIIETIDDDIFAIDLCVKIDYGGDLGTKVSIIKSWDKNSDAAAIAAHNSGTPLSYTFYNDTTGEVLDDVTAATSFDGVPLLSKTIEIARDRVFLGGNLLGYTSPSVSSLGLTVANFDTGGAGTYTSAWKYMTLNYYNTSDPSRTPIPKNVYYVYNATLPITSYYYTDHHDSGTRVSSLNASDAFVNWDTELNLAYYIIRNNTGLSAGQAYLYSPPPAFYDGAMAVSLIVSSTDALPQFFKSNSTYKVSIAFYDRYRRKCGIVKYQQAVIPIRTYNQTIFSSTINWTLSNTDALDEIPVWAYYYQIHITKNQTTNFFMQGNSIHNAYVTKATDGTYTYNKTTWAANTNYATSFDITQLISNGLGYTFTEGDLLILYKTDGTSVTLPILGVDGANILCKPTDIGDLTGDVSNVIEIYTPYKPSTLETYYETGPVYPVLSPASSGRTYSTTSGQINGDCYAIERDKGSSTLYFVEAMSPNDKTWSDWQTDTGWPNEVDTIGQTSLPNSVVFSDTFIQGTKVNGLNKFEPLNETDLGAENGAIQKLQLSNKIQTDGTVMLAVCEDETVSMYLGEQELFDTQGSAFISKSSNVIGTTKALQGSLGTRNPESVFEYNGQVYWWDTRNSTGVQYSTNGLFPISEKKMTRPSKLFSKKFVSLTTAQIEALGSDPFIIGGFDPYHKEVLFSIPSTETPPKGYLTDFSVIYPYDIYDGQGKVLVYKHHADMWFGSMSFQTEFFVRMDNDLYSFKNGLWIHNQPNLCNFYGTQNTANLMFSANPGAIHTFLSIGLESNKTPSWVHFRTEDPYTQSSDLPYVGVSDFTSKQGVIEASLMRDRLSPNATGDYDAKELRGDKLIGKALLTNLQYEFVIDSSPLQLRTVDVGNIVNTGTLINK